VLLQTGTVIKVQVVKQSLDCVVNTR